MALAAGVKVAAAVAAAAALASVAAAAAPVPRLPAPSFTEPGQPTAFAVSGPRVAVASGCTVLVANLARGTKPVRVRSIGGDCGSDPGDSWVLDLHLGRATVMGTTISSPSPHGDAFTLVTGPLLGPLHEVGGWDWRDDDVPHAGGGGWAVAAGGGARRA